MIKEETKRFIEALRVPIYLTLVLWIVHMFKIASTYRFANYGIFPRSLDGLKGIIFAPVIHSNFGHLISNTLPLFALTLILFYFYKRAASVAFLGIYFVTGFGVWLFARESYHIGASGVVYGLVAFVFWSGIFRRNAKSIILALVVLVMYQGMFAGIVPQEKGISWESHLIGAIVGIVMAFFLKTAIEKDEEEHPDPWANEAVQGSQYYFNREVFDMTKQERKLMEDAAENQDW